MCAAPSPLQQTTAVAESPEDDIVGREAVQLLSDPRLRAQNPAQRARLLQRLQQAERQRTTIDPVRLAEAMADLQQTHSQQRSVVSADAFMEMTKCREKPSNSSIRAPQRQRSWQQFGVLAGFRVQLANGLTAPRSRRPRSDTAAIINVTRTPSSHVPPPLHFFGVGRTRWPTLDTL